MKTFKEFLTEEYSISGEMVNSGMLEGYVKLFYNTLSKQTKSFKKEPDISLYTMLGCGKIFDENTKEKIVDSRPYYKVTTEILTKYNRIFYTLELDVDSSNTIIMYREYKDKSKLSKYRLVMLAKRNIMNTLKSAGFSVRSDKTTIIASIPDYVKNPSSENALLSMNKHQEKLLNVVKKLFSYNGVYPAFNMYAITLKQASPLVDIEDENKLNRVLVGNNFDKVIVTTNGKIEFFRFEHDTEPEAVLLNCFEHITKDYELDDE